MPRTIKYTKKDADTFIRTITDTDEISYAQYEAEINATIANFDAAKAQYVAQKTEVLSTRSIKP
jgi:hypothetical protein